MVKAVLIRVSYDLYNKLLDIAEQEDRSLNNLIVHVLRNFVERYEDELGEELGDLGVWDEEDEEEEEE